MCMIDGCDETYRVYRGPMLVRGRKQYRCEECSREITKGESHYYATGLGDGSWTTHRMCVHCRVAAQWLQQNCHGFLHGGVLEDIDEHIHEYRGAAMCIARLKRLDVGMRREWKIERGMRKGELMPIPILPAKLEPKHAH